jgi:hypothetical protein
MALTKDERDKAERINKILDAMREKLGIGERQAFTDAGVLGSICDYLNALHTCPDAVVEYWVDALSPKATEPRA